MYSSKVFLIIPIENMTYSQGTPLYCVPHCNKPVHDLSQIHKHTLVKYLKCQRRSVNSSRLQESLWKSCSSYNCSVFATSALAFHMASKKEAILPLFLPPKRRTEE